MAIAKGKMGLLIAALKPSKSSEKETESDDPNKESVAAKLADAIVGGKRDAIKAALVEFHDCVSGEDKKEKEDEDEKEESEDEESKDD